MIRVVICVLCLSFITACKEEVPPPRVPEIKIGVTTYRKEDTFIATVVSALEEVAKSAEKTENVKIVVNIVDGKGNQVVQNEQIEKFIEQGCDVICVNLVDRTVAAAIIDKAKAAKIPLVFYNREPVKEDLERWDKVYYVGAVAKESGLMQGELVAEAYRNNPQALDKNGDGKLQYVMLEGEQGHQDSLLRTEYSIKAMVNAGITVDKLANDTANWHRSQATTKMKQWIEKYDDQIELVLSNNDDMALGAIDAYEAAKKMKQLPYMVGIDGTPLALLAMEEGTLKGTIKNDAQAQAQAMFDICYALSTGGDVRQNVTLRRDKYVFIEYTPLPTLEN